MIVNTYSRKTLTIKMVIRALYDWATTLRYVMPEHMQVHIQSIC